MFTFQDDDLLTEGEVFQHQAAATTKSAKDSSAPEPKEVKHGSKVIADRLLVCLLKLLISQPYRVVTSHTGLYGTTSGGGASQDGTVFKITPIGTLTTLLAFDLADGVEPEAGLVLGTDGNLYGTTANGGTGSACTFQVGCGTVFKITPTGTLTTLYSFCSQTDCADGVEPLAGLVLGTDGNFYGTTLGGAGSFCNSSRDACGTVFKITPSGTLTTVGRTPAAAAGPACSGCTVEVSIGAQDQRRCGILAVRAHLFAGEIDVPPLWPDQFAATQAAAAIQ
jgi:uncharacterized repeat protein (TIGR03803 family)